mgnify:CR=1 FL=1
MAYQNDLELSFTDARSIITGWKQNYITCFFLFNKFNAVMLPWAQCLYVGETGQYHVQLDTVTIVGTAWGGLLTAMF